MDALTLSTGTSAAAIHAMDRIRLELGQAVADSVVAGSVRTTQTMERYSTRRHEQEDNDVQHQLQSSSSLTPLPPKLSTEEMTKRAMAIVQEMLNDTSTILYTQGRQHLLQQAMEDGSSIVCTNCGDMISRERWRQHAEYWCRRLSEDGIDDDEEEGMDM